MNEQVVAKEWIEGTKEPKGTLSHFASSNQSHTSGTIDSEKEEGGRKNSGKIKTILLMKMS